MKAIIAAVTAALPLTVAIAEPAQSADKLAEVILSDKLDEPRGYCLDIAGGRGKNAPLDKGLQAHTCYHYTGGILEDQGFDTAQIDNGRFLIPFFNVCMAVPSIAMGAAIFVAPCKEADTQKFALKSNGQLVIQANPKLCVTVSSTEKKEGRGGSPIHVMRPLSLQPCDDLKKAYQTWSLHSL